ncbi:adhesion G-protein coupled receptor G7 isoform X3 [Rhinolophus ferrumequinum]|uniref:adhesion G-protein coupled receptor G7 isoform X3 n=1 Tax=Rhinolophus ferrumequinum TaxID=59479 RepID=UPI00140FF5CB|nr:adhesion G-protein coupled receptor G7 isoform X3 [Rhinolophus ferrumequinum]
MAFCRTCDSRVLVAVVCGLLTAIVLGLDIWMTVLRINRGKPPPSSNIITGMCSNGGTWENNRCICSEEWTGLRCTRANFCEKGTYGNFSFERIPVGRYGSSLQKCGKNTLNADNPIATALCDHTENGTIQLQNVTVGNCNENLQTLEKQIDNITHSSSNISKEAQVLTSDASRLTPENVTSAAKVVGQIFNTSRNASVEAKVVAVTTVSQLLDASEEVFERAAAAAANTLETLTEQLEDYSISLSNQPVVNPNIAIQSFETPSGSTEGHTSVRFTLYQGTSNSLTSSSTCVNTNEDGCELNKQTELQIRASKSNATSYGFIVYQNDKLFQSKTFKLKFNQKIVSSTTNSSMHKGHQNVSVDMAFRPQHNPKEFQLNSYACVYWNISMKDWDTKGCEKEGFTNGFLRCSCNHMTSFTVLMNFKKNYEYPESLDTLSNVGCALSITGLVLTIIFQIATSCWLAIPEGKNFIKSPWLWAFILPVTIILVSNVIMFIVILVKVLWKNDQNLTSTKKNSSLKKILSTLSIAVVFGITWILAYFMLIDNNNIRVIFSYIFCIFNTTQGLQIFILYTVKTKIFQDEASKMFKSLSSSAERLKPLRPFTELRLRLRMYNMLRSFPTLNERFKVLDPFIVTEETTLSESEETKASI